MECPTCGGQSLTQGDEGMLVCDDCADRFPGFRDEELDDAFVGTAVSNRTSQASQASQVRARIAAAEREEKAKRAAPRVSVPDEEIVFCDAVLTLTKCIAKALVDSGIFPARIYAPLLQILIHWVRRRHALVAVRRLGGARGPKVEHSRYHKRFNITHVLSFLALAALVVRSPVLPRDLVALVAQGRLPYFDAAKRFLTDEMFGVQSVRHALSPLVVPSTMNVRYGVLLHGTGEYSWPPLREFFNGKQKLYSMRNVASIPLGSLHITLRRIIRLLGLPDAFGARVLRYIDLRQQARRELTACKAPYPMSGYRTRNVWDTKGGVAAFSWNVRAIHDCSEYTTDRTLQIDIVNTMRICYGHCDGNLPQALHSLDSSSESHDACIDNLQQEWHQAVRHMREWVMSGGGDDACLAIWGTLSGPAVSNLRGKRLKRYLEYVESTEADNEIPLFMRSYLRAFQSVSQLSAGPSRQSSASQSLRQEENDWNFAESHLRAKRSFAGLGGNIVESLTSGTAMVDDDKELDREPLLPVIYRGVASDRRGLHYVWNEPVEIGLAWTMMRHFFAGSPTGFHSDRAISPTGPEATNLVETAEKTLRMVLDYINIQLGGSTYRWRKLKKRKKDEDKLFDDDEM